MIVETNDNAMLAESSSSAARISNENLDVKEEKL
jgi:hypothetical protein